ncbi:hypothetical protein Tco_0627591 [Tanacetum coccineum]|uniref:Uncharacterized protein n=1 Tax=Tanacetum coccineum TaxID=301880 RepID=A0ABQ4WMW4_9ASTR
MSLWVGYCGCGWKRHDHSFATAICRNVIQFKRSVEDYASEIIVYFYSSDEYVCSGLLSGGVVESRLMALSGHDEVFEIVGVASYVLLSSISVCRGYRVVERISKKRTKNEAKTTKPDTKWKSVEKDKVK